MLRWLLTVKNGSACLCVTSSNIEAHMLGRCTNHVISFLTLLLLCIFALILVFTPCVSNFIAYMQQIILFDNIEQKNRGPVYSLPISQLKYKKLDDRYCRGFYDVFLLCAPQMVCLKGCIAKQSLTCLQLPQLKLIPIC